MSGRGRPPCSSRPMVRRRQLRPLGELLLGQPPARSRSGAARRSRPSLVPRAPGLQPPRPAPDCDPSSVARPSWRVSDGCPIEVRSVTWCVAAVSRTLAQRRTCDAGAPEPRPHRAQAGLPHPGGPRRRPGLGGRPGGDLQRRDRDPGPPGPAAGPPRRLGAGPGGQGGGRRAGRPGPLPGPAGRHRPGRRDHPADRRRRDQGAAPQGVPGHQAPGPPGGDRGPAPAGRPGRAGPAGRPAGRLAAAGAPAEAAPPPPGEPEEAA